MRKSENIFGTMRFKQSTVIGKCRSGILNGYEREQDRLHSSERGDVIEASSVIGDLRVGEAR